MHNKYQFNGKNSTAMLLATGVLRANITTAGAISQHQPPSGTHQGRNSGKVLLSQGGFYQNKSTSPVCVFCFHPSHSNTHHNAIYAQWNEDDLYELSLPHSLLGINSFHRSLRFSNMARWGGAEKQGWDSEAGHNCQVSWHPRLTSF